MYDFSTLNSFEFEKLACDLLNSQSKNSKNRFQVFKEGKDKGIDLFYESSYNDNIIVQVKHYIKTSFSGLKYNLKNEELPKVRLLNPESYFVVTSTELSLKDKLEIKDIFKPFIKSTDDIYGREDLNALLRENKGIEDSHYKLWFSSTAALRNIQKYKFEGRRKQFTINVLKKKLRLFVPTFSYFHSLNKLKENKFVIITGEPGVGKTTISDMVIYDFIRRDYDINIIYDSISEIEESINFDKSKQIFYFDDFLGHTQAEISKSKAAENYLLKIINLIEGNENKFLILNTRKFILSSFLEESERLNKTDILRKESKIEVKEYSYGVKRRILDLHILESNLDISNLNILKNYATYICLHQNFSPRIIEFFTSNLNKNFNPNEFEKFIVENLNNPKEIWKHAYLKQISDYDRFLLNTLYSSNGNIKKDELEVLYNSRLNYEVKNNNYKKPIDSFNKSLRILNEGFLSINNFSNYIEISFINPSLQDYLNYFIEDNSSEKERIIKSAHNIEQWLWIFFKYNKFEKLNPNYSKFFLDNNKEYHKNEESIFLSAIFIYFYIDSENPIISKLLKSITDWEFIFERNSYTFYLLDHFMKVSKSNVKINKTITSLDNSLFLNYINDYETLYDIIDRTQLLENHYDFSLKKYIRENIDNIVYRDSIKYFLKNLESLFKDLYDEEFEYLIRLKEKESFEDSIFHLKKNYIFIQKNIFEDFFFSFSSIENRDWDEIIKNNIIEGVTEIPKKINEDEVNRMYENEYFSEVYDNYEYDLESYYNDKKTIIKHNPIIFDEPDDLPF
ncbi:restriction endonuclease [uncultured Polaribacter sp.]|uniref:nSTAND3 domain-containing NTPase n=1 Tax=uncultured Polaribacter sp. TaxID=174711 RepID=UPI00260570F0|nr:restriction endonuclease [uncultured Polaribacter sp.]